jgi:hypothetical protein
MFDLVDESLDQVSLFVEVLVVRDSLRAGTLRWNDGLSTRVCNGGSKVIGVVALTDKLEWLADDEFSTENLLLAAQRLEAEEIV